MATKSEINQIKGFLRERKLIRVYNRYQKIKPYRKRKFTIQYHNVKKQLLVYKKKDKLYIVDQRTLKTLATTKKYNLNNIKAELSTPKLTKKKIANRQFDYLGNKIRLREVQRVRLTNFTQIDRTTPLRMKNGKLFMSVTFFKGNTKTTKEGGSQRRRNMSISSEHRKSFDEAFGGALSQIDFSYDHYRVNWIHYSYFIQIR